MIVNELTFLLLKKKCLNVTSLKMTIRDKIKDEQDALIWKLFLRCFTQPEMVELTGVPQQTISDRIQKLTENHINGKIGIPPSSLQLYNDWRFGKRADQYGLENHINGKTTQVTSLKMIIYQKMKALFE